VRCFTRHGVPRPVKASLISPGPPQPQGLPRHPQWRCRQGPNGPPQNSFRISGRRPQPHTPGASPHTNVSRSSTRNWIPAERSTFKNMQCHHTNTKTYDLLKGQLTLGDCGSTRHTGVPTARPDGVTAGGVTGGGGATATAAAAGRPPLAPPLPPLPPAADVHARGVGGGGVTVPPAPPAPAHERVAFLRTTTLVRRLAEVTS